MNTFSYTFYIFRVHQEYFYADLTYFKYMNHILLMWGEQIRKLNGKKQKKIKIKWEKKEKK